MLRRSSLLIRLGSIIVLVAAIYAALPLIIAGFLEHRLATFGFSEVNVNAGYPRWDGVRLGLVAVSRRLGNWTYTVQATDVAVRYKLSELIAGRFAGVGIRQAVVERKPARNETVSESTKAPLGTLLLGQWLAQLPAEQLVLDDLNIHWQEPSGEVYLLCGGGYIQDHQLYLKGMLWPQGKDEFSLAFSARVSAAGELELAVYPPEQPAQPIFHVTNHLGVTEEGLRTIAGAMQAKLDTLAPLLGPWFGLGGFVPNMKGSLQSSWQGTAPAVAATAAAWLAEMQLSSKHRLEIKAARVGEMVNAVDIQIQATVQIKQGVIYWQLDDQSRVTGHLNFASPRQAERGEQPITIDFPNGISGLLEPRAEAFALRLERGGRLRISPLRWGDFFIPESRIELADSATLSYRPASGRWNWGPVSLALVGSPWRWRDSTVANEGIALKIDEFGGAGDDWHGEGGVRVKAIRPAIGKGALAQGELMAKWRLGPEQLDAQGTLATSNGGLVLAAHGLHEFAGGSGRLQFDLNPVVFEESGHPLSRLLEPWPYPMDLSSGRLSASGSIAWRRPVGHGASNALQLENEITLKLEDVAGYYRKIGFSGLSANLALADRNALRTRETAQLRIASLDVGIPITELKAVADVTPHPQTRRPVIHVAGLSADLLGGRAHSAPFEWNLAAASNRLTIELEGLALSEIIALEGQKGLQGDGRLDGHLPVEITAEGIVLQGGELHARSPGGVIRYRPSESVRTLAGDGASGFVLQALSNLRYEALNVKADSTPAGDLTLRVELRGNNPDWQSGRPVHLNVNLQENIPMLLRSLRFADELGESIGKRAQEHFQKNH